MRSKIRYDLLTKSQKYAKSLNFPLQKKFYEQTYKYVYSMRSDILRPFQNVCIHGNYPEIMIQKLIQPHEKDIKFDVHAHLTDLSKGKNENIQFLNEQSPYNSIIQNEKYDLIVSCLQLHHYDQANLIENYKKKLKPDGALIGCCWAENTLKQLSWSFLMAQNQRSGGVSPKIFTFPTLGTIGNYLTSSSLKLPTIIIQDFEIQFNSVVDILSFLQVVGESGTLQGRRKGTYKDVLLAACAYYDSEFLGEQKKNVKLSLEMAAFVAWKQHLTQPKPLQRRKVQTNQFFDQIMKLDETSKMYRITEGIEQPQQIIKNKQEEQKKENDGEKQRSEKTQGKD